MSVRLKQRHRGCSTLSKKELLLLVANQGHYELHNIEECSHSVSSVRAGHFLLVANFYCNFFLHYVCKFSVVQPHHSSFLAQWLQAVLFIQPMSIINACLIQHTIKADVISSDVQCLK